MLTVIIKRFSSIVFIIIIICKEFLRWPPANAGDIRDAGLIPELGRFPGGGYGNPLQYPCLENPMDRGAWWAIVRGVAKSGT